ncbi:hypothetical protein [Streptomyces sp. NPDC056169]
MTPVTSLCPSCDRPVSVPVHVIGEPREEPRHIGIPGNPTDCPQR